MGENGCRKIDTRIQKDAAKGHRKACGAGSCLYEGKPARNLLLMVGIHAIRTDTHTHTQHARMHTHTHTHTHRQWVVSIATGWCGHQSLLGL